MVIGLPDKLFYGTGIPAAVLVFRKKKSDDKVLFIDASRDYEAGKNQNYLRESDLQRILDTVAARQDVDKYAHLATPAEIAENDFNLNIPRYVDTFEEEAEIDLMAVRIEREQLKAELASLETTRRTWIAQISHELRTPLSVLRGEIESIEDGVRQPTPAVMGRLRDEVMQLTRLVDDLHTLSVADVDGMPCTFAPGMVGPALQNVVQRFQAQARQAGLTLHCLPPDNTPQLTARWDFGRIEQLLSNLLTNSLRYTQAPGRVTVSWQRQGDHLRLSVEDTAPGVSNADLPRLFDPLFRADASRQRTAACAPRSGQPRFR